jgi:endoglucanase
VDVHHYNEIMQQPDAHAARFVALWQQIAERYNSRPASVIFELLNEPNTNLNPVKWNKLANETIRSIRKTNPERLILVDSYFWAAPGYLRALDLPKQDANIAATFHMYQPILFTHQGADWMEPEFQTRGVVFPGPPKAPVTLVPAALEKDWVKSWFDSYHSSAAAQNPSGPKTVQSEFDQVMRFVADTGRRVYLGEFGAVDHADADSRERYVRMVREQAEQRGIGWAYWDDGGRFKALDVTTGTWVPYLKAALLD